MYVKDIYADDTFRQKLLDKLNFAASNLEAFENDEELQNRARGGVEEPQGGEARSEAAGPADFFAWAPPASR